MKIILVCSVGLSTRELVSQMRKISEEKNLNLDIKGIGYSDINDEIEGANVILLGPQVKYRLRKVIEVAAPKDIPVEVIDPITYGVMNAKKVMELAMNIVYK